MLCSPNRCHAGALNPIWAHYSVSLPLVNEGDRLFDYWGEQGARWDGTEREAGEEVFSQCANDLVWRRLDYWW
ncbi:hypothetical protein L6164_018725 [Bauhinia variegata]|uniref:Uncharacterized protein n=1 Tax=Bauhinia variegata TaxID=167791 RepID=A0ACB9NCN3_BAUVA|nr:hypothetical protein L6164_018725 [Bauhinia variegata]